ncbi:hypothetical protein RIF23_19285 [Lipingzhangella sp. LS1_29]|uniref:XRE family transcriptional regulator n=1 Tax=Lipingzhangella rawalii TaxID=2055835 RepID=A0ABU2HAY2_9ACTN|nr:hypothetical protein [Lipingzhangella rawalii]MDS1272436.1 hypothetical protein [Lipingzhangella rawalii]
MLPRISAHIPLVCRPKAPALPLAERLTHLTGQVDDSASASHHNPVARASGVLNYAALIASDVGMPDLAADLCWRQHRVFAEAGRLTGDIAVMALMPLLNVSRLLTRGGDSDGAYDVLTQLYRAAQQRSTTDIRGHTVDLSILTTSESDHYRVCQELWGAVLVDGARALARSGRWSHAADALTVYRGVGHRLLDGRQIYIMSLLERGLHDQARAATEATASTDSWENAIAALLRASCHSQAESVRSDELDDVLRESVAVLSFPDPATALFQARVGLAALDLICDHNGPQSIRLYDALHDAALLDAYAARDVRNHPRAERYLDDEQKQHLDVVLRTAGLGAGTLPHPHMNTLTVAVEEAEVQLHRLLS